MTAHNELLKPPRHEDYAHEKWSPFELTMGLKGPLRKWPPLLVRVEAESKFLFTANQISAITHPVGTSFSF